MNRKEIIVFVLVVVAVAVAVAVSVSCRSNQKIADTHDSKISLDWEGVYTGTIPAADVDGINVRMQLKKDNTYELTYDYIGKPEAAFTFTGSFRWDDTGNVITIEIADAPSHYKVEENRLIQLDMEGNLITGDLADNYVLQKSAQ